MTPGESGARSARVLFLTGDPIGARIGGAAARCLEMARALGDAGHLPTVATPALGPDAAGQPFAVRAFDASHGPGGLRALVAGADVAVLPLHALVEFPWLSRVTTPLVFDLYDPMAFELLGVETDGPLPARQRRLRLHAAILRQVLRRGDFFLCASERQRDLWVGALLAADRVVPADPPDPTLRRLIDVVPFGLPSGPAPTPSTARLLRRAHPAIGERDTLLVWGGAIWSWLDPFTLIRAMELIDGRRGGVHVVFLGTSHPAGGDPRASAVGPARELARAAGLDGRCVHFHEGWVPYAERGSSLAECDAAVTTHPECLESRFAFRTRVLDALWAGLPVICTEGDVLAELVRAEGLGLTVPPEDAPALARAIERVAADRAFAAGCRARVAAVRPRLTWASAVGPLVRFCATPARAPGATGAVRRALDNGWQGAIAARQVLTASGPREVLQRIHRAWLLRS